MKTRHTIRIVFAFCLLLAFCLSPGTALSQESPPPQSPTGIGNDVYPDLAVGVPGREVSGYDNAGMVAVAHGTADGLEEHTGLVVDQSWPGGEHEGLNEYFGQALAGGDFDGDGYMDLAIGTPGETRGTVTEPIYNAGLITILYGDSNGINPEIEQSRDHEAFGTNVPETGDRLGAALAAGDFDCDGFDDLAIGVPGQNVLGGVPYGGVVNVVYGTSNGMDWDGYEALAQGFAIQETPEESDNFGSVLAAGDINGDACDDLAIGVPNEDVTVGPTTYTDAGVVQIVYGSRSGLSRGDDDLIYQGNEGVQDEPSDYDRFGFALAIGKFDAGYYEDLAVGVPYEDYSGTDAGVIHILWGNWSGITTDNDLRFYQDLIEGNNETGDRFGWALAAGDIDDDGKDDLAVGAPNEDLSGFNSTGTVALLWGPFNRLDETFWYDEDYADDLQFGYALAIADFNHNGHPDLAIGVPGYYYGGVTKPNSGQVFVIDAWTGDFTSFIYLNQISGGMLPKDGDRLGEALAALDEPHYLQHLFLPVVTKN